MLWSRYIYHRQETWTNPIYTQLLIVPASPLPTFIPPQSLYCLLMVYKAVGLFPLPQASCGRAPQISSAQPGSELNIGPEMCFLSLKFRRERLIKEGSSSLRDRREEEGWRSRPPCFVVSGLNKLNLNRLTFPDRTPEPVLPDLVWSCVVQSHLDYPFKQT